MQSLNRQHSAVWAPAQALTLGLTWWKYGEDLMETETTLSTVINYTLRQQPCGEGSDAMKSE